MTPNKDEFPPSPLHGAAYRVLLERCDVGGCSTLEALTKIRETLASASEWSLAEKSDVREAYRWAIVRVTQEAENRLDLYRNSAAVMKAFDQIPRPPQ